MTAAEISALRQELEDALLTSLTDFKRLTGLSVVGIDVHTVVSHQLHKIKPDIRVIGAHVKLESL